MKLNVCISLVCVIGMMIACSYMCGAQDQDNRSEEREMLYNNLKNAFPRISSKLLSPFLDIPRHRFVKGNMKTLAYQDMDLPAGTNTIIPAPSLVLEIIKTLELGKKHSVLIIGRGTGYMGAVISKIADSVTLVELDGTYFGTLNSLLDSLDLENLELLGALNQLPRQTQAAPRRFDRIVIHAGIRNLPVRVTSMLGEEGRLIVPITGESGFQSLLHLRTGGGLEIESVRESFFPLVEGLY